MIKLFGKKDTVFNSNGIMVINPISLIETKESSLNGWFINAVVPIKYNDDLEEGLHAYVDTKSKGGQPFVINNIKRTDKHIEFTANHVVFDSINYILKDVRPTSMSAVGALTYVNERTDITSPYTMASNVANSQTAYFINRTLLEALDTIQERWGGVYDVDKFNKTGVMLLLSYVQLDLMVLLYLRVIYSVRLIMASLFLRLSSLKLNSKMKKEQKRN